VAAGMILTRTWWVLGIVLVLTAVVVCLLPGREVPGVFEMNDKLSHIAGHGGLALYFAGLVTRSRWWKIFVFLLLLGSGIEVAQYHMQLGREGDARDVLANAAGAALGLLVARLGLARWPQAIAWLAGRRQVAE
jgi:VanZ family protein